MNRSQAGGTPPEENSDSRDASSRLDSWKAVAAYLGRSDKTVRRWEEKEGLPIHRLHHDKRGTVYAYKQELDAWWQLRKATIETETDEPLAADSFPPPPEDRRRHLSRVLWLVAGVVVAAAVFMDVWLRMRPQEAIPRTVQFSRITDFVGMEDSPAISPDGKMVAFVARNGGRRHLWIRLLSGGIPVQITHDDADHEQPRWTPDAGSLIYYSPSLVAGKQGTIWEIPALGGPARRIASALGGGDCSHDGKWVALFRAGNGKAELVTVERRGSAVQLVTQLSSEDLNDRPRWSPDDRWIAFQSHGRSSFDDRVNLLPASGGTARVLASSEDLLGLTWSGDGSALVYSSSSGSTVLYPPIHNLRTVRLTGTGDRQLTFGDISYVEPDLHAGIIVASRVRSQSDIWKFPIGGEAKENTRRGVRITAQTGQVQTPSLSPDGRELVYLSDIGGHGNLWIAKTDGSMVRQVTYERDPAVSVGVPVWSPAGDNIVFVMTRHGQTGQWIIHPDGSGMRQLVPAGVWSDWSADGRWVYYGKTRNGVYLIERVPVDGGAPVVVRSDNAVAPTAIDGSVLYYATFLKGDFGAWDLEYRRARPENGKSEVIAHIAGERVPNEISQFQMVLSPDGKWLAAPLTDGPTTNLWLLPASGGPMRQVTDFGQRSTLIVRRVSWSADSKEVYAAVADCDADIVMLEGLPQ
jgi:Tol biopolymer transport system component